MLASLARAALVREALLPTSCSSAGRMGDTQCLNDPEGLLRFRAMPVPGNRDDSFRSTRIPSRKGVAGERQPSRWHSQGVPVLRSCGLALETVQHTPTRHQGLRREGTSHGKSWPEAQSGLDRHSRNALQRCHVLITPQYSQYELSSPNATQSATAQPNE